MSMSAERIAEKYYPDIYKFCCAKCRNENVAQDITQETFLLFINKFDELTDINIRSWLLSVANNKLREYFRKSQIENTFVCVDNVEISTFDSYEYDKIDVDELFDDVQKKILNILNDKEFLSRYNKNNSMSIGIVSSVEAWHKELYNELSDSNIMAFISAWFEFKYRKYYFFYDVFNHKSRWNDSDRNFVLIISKIIASVL